MKSKPCHLCYVNYTTVVNILKNDYQRIMNTSELKNLIVDKYDGEILTHDKASDKLC